MDAVGNFIQGIGHRVSDLISGEDHEHHVQNLQVTETHHEEEEGANLLEEDVDVEDLAIEAAKQEYANIKPSLLDSWQGNNFYRYEIQLSLLAHREKNIVYWFETEHGRRVAQPQTWNFFVPALDEQHNWAFYSCNGFTSDVEDPETNFHGANPLWDDLLAAHDHKPFHTMVGGGDQIYNDDVLATPEMKAYLEMGKDERLATQWSNEYKYATEKYYFDHYVEHFTTGTYSQALSLIPSVNTWDDHDIFDGFGSYSEDYQLSSVFQGKFLITSSVLHFFTFFSGINRVDEGKGGTSLFFFECSQIFLFLLRKAKKKKKKKRPTNNRPTEPTHRHRHRGREVDLFTNTHKHKHTTPHPSSLSSYSTDINISISTGKREAWPYYPSIFFPSLPYSSDSVPGIVHPHYPYHP
ncbi:MAG: hypothetical protein BYD32DRAFT_284439 [Podila humilis]|nr:MAG: hypothetical protein BYD32DRAFT_284439 [Podila humilis]